MEHWTTTLVIWPFNQSSHMAVLILLWLSQGFFEGYLKVYVLDSFTILALQVYV